MAIKEHYYELLDFFGELFPYLFENLANRFARELKAINEQFEFEPFVCKKPYLKLTFE
jgi:aspartyl-tRNA synthetase